MPLPRFAKIYGSYRLAGSQSLYISSKTSIILAALIPNYPYTKLLRKSTAYDHSLTLTEYYGRRTGQHDGRIADTEEAMVFTKAIRYLNVQLLHAIQTRNK
jgi:hypothetical protein